jgi:ribosome-binding protein aMBF1 (putative translation factor)
MRNIGTDMERGLACWLTISSYICEPCGARVELPGTWTQHHRSGLNLCRQCHQDMSLVGVRKIPQPGRS